MSRQASASSMPRVNTLSSRCQPSIAPSSAERGVGSIAIARPQVKPDCRHNTAMTIPGIGQLAGANSGDTLVSGWMNAVREDLWPR
jgi:hypothetical protein